MTDLTGAELDALEVQVSERAEWRWAGPVTPESLRRLITEVRRWRDKAADEEGLARLAVMTNAARRAAMVNTRAVGSPEEVIE